MPSLSAHRALALAALSLAALVHMALSLAATCPCVLALISKEGGGREGSGREAAVAREGSGGEGAVSAVAKALLP